MAVTATPVFAQAQRVAMAVCTAAKTTMNDAANAVLLATAGANGSLVTTLTAIPRATVTATQCQLYVSGDGGTTLNLVQTMLMPAYTLAQTTANAATDFGFSDYAPLRLGPNDRLYVAIGVALAGGISFRAAVQDF